MAQVPAGKLGSGPGKRKRGGGTLCTRLDVMEVEVKGVEVKERAEVEGVVEYYNYQGGDGCNMDTNVLGGLHIHLHPPPLIPPALPSPPHLIHLRHPSPCPPSPRSAWFYHAILLCCLNPRMQMLSRVIFCFAAIPEDERAGGGSECVSV